ncbi:unnamed protein product [Effrenium voratum]|nr:unnamed protein product [Effrenium voratum]
MRSRRQWHRDRRALRELRLRDARRHDGAGEDCAGEFLGPPALLCEGGAWPPRLEQVAEGYQIVPEVGSGLPLRQRRFALRDLLDLAPARDSSLEIQVAEVSAFRLTTHMPTVPARPVLVPGRRQEAWANVPRAFTTRRIPAAGAGSFGTASAQSCRRGSTP